MSDADIRAKNMINAALADVEKSLAKPPPKRTPEQLCLDRANARIIRAQSRFIAEFKAMKVPPTFNEAVELIYPILRQEFNDWNKDEFATLACMSLAIQASNSLRDHLI